MVLHEKYHQHIFNMFIACAQHVQSYVILGTYLSEK